MSIVEFQGGPVTHRYFMGKTKSWLVSQIIELATQLHIQEAEGPEDRGLLLTKSKEELARVALRLHRRFVALLPAEDSAHV